MASPDGPMELILEAQRELHLLNNGLADLLGIHKRTLQRWLKSGTSTPVGELHTLAEAVLPTNPDLARRLVECARRVAAEAGLSVAAWGLAETPPPAPGPAPATLPAPSAPGGLTQGGHPRAARPEDAELVLFAAASALDLPSRAVLPAVTAALRRALSLGLDLGSLLQLLESHEKPAEPKR
jgi:hypothetical protein